MENEIIFSTLKPSLYIPDPERYEDDSNPVLKYLSQILLEENIDENNPNMFYDPIALRASENSFYEALHQNPYHSDGRSPTSTVGSSSDYTTNSSHIDSYNSDPKGIVDPVESKSSDPPEFSHQSSSQTNSDRLNCSLYCYDSIMNAQMDSFLNANMVPNIFSDLESTWRFKRGMGEASIFFPTGNQLVIDLDKNSFPPSTEELTRDAFVNIEKDHSANSCRGKKHYHTDECGIVEERSSKHFAVYEEEVELSEVFDKVLLCTDDNDCPSGVTKDTQQKGRSNGKSHSTKQGDSCEIVDLASLLTICALSIGADDHSTAKEQLKKIRQHSSPTGDANQRLAHAFANALEARLAGTGTHLYAALAPNNIAASELLKSYFSSWPFMRISIFFANKMIYKVASKNKSLHVIDFGILYGIQWPTLIRDLSQRPGGPPKLRITGIELPQPGFRPTQMVEDTGCRLAKYCERFGVPFEYNAITKKNWETIKIDDLKIVSGEVVAVNCLFRFENLLDETVVVADNPRDAVLNLIREVNPRIYVQAVLSGSHSTPFFVPRFREALYFYSAVFDMFDATLPRNYDQRLNFEQEFIGREIMNIIACEGMERLERPETYKQWQLRIMRAGFKPMSIKTELVKELKGKAKAGGYHKDFLFDENGNWILQGWKGRIIGGSSCWVPT